jgi:hypothetical protein
MTWDVTVTDTLAESYLLITSLLTGGAAKGAANRKELDLNCTALLQLGEAAAATGKTYEDNHHILTLCTGCL